MPFGFGDDKEENPPPIKNYLTNEGRNSEEINKITEILNPDERVLLVARRSRLKPGGSISHQILSMQQIEESLSEIHICLE
jgi:hypothetical protein